METLTNLTASLSSSLTGTHILLAAGCLFGGWLLRWMLMKILKRIVHLSAKTETAVDDILIDAVSKPLSWFCFLLGLWAAFEVLPIPEDFAQIEQIVRTIFKAFTVWLVIWFAVRLVDRTAHHMETRAADSKSPALDFVPLFRKTTKIILVLIGILIIVQNLGYSVASLLAGLGLGGLAIGLAAKDTIANFFGSVVIFVDRPFTRGDWIKIGEHEGTVEEIGVRVTRLRTFADHLITIPNATLTTTAIINFTAMRKRRIKFTLGLNVDTPPDTVELVIAKIKALIEHDARLVPNDSAVVFSEIGTYSLTIDVTCFALSTSYADWAQIRQELLLNVNRLKGELGIEFALPTQKVINTVKQ